MHSGLLYLTIDKNLIYISWFDWKLNFQEPLLLYSPTAAPATPTTPTPLC